MNYYTNPPNLWLNSKPERSGVNGYLIIHSKHLFLNETGAFLLNRVIVCFFGVLVSKLIQIRGGP